MSAEDTASNELLTAVPDRLKQLSGTETAPTYTETDDQYDTDADAELSDEEASELSRAFALNLEEARKIAATEQSSQSAAAPLPNHMVDSPPYRSDDGDGLAGGHRRVHAGITPLPLHTLPAAGGSGEGEGEVADEFVPLSGSLTDREYIIACHSPRVHTLPTASASTDSTNPTHANSSPHGCRREERAAGRSSSGYGSSAHTGSSSISLSEGANKEATKVGQHRAAGAPGILLAYSDIGMLSAKEASTIQPCETSHSFQSPNRQRYATPRPQVPLDKVSVRELITSYENLIQRKFVDYHQEQKTREKLYKYAFCVCVCVCMCVCVCVCVLVLC
jgi:hypothetical protein